MPILVVLGITTSAGVFTFAVVSDREQKLRYLLNFAGMRSTSYYLGMFFADWLVFIAP